MLHEWKHVALKINNITARRLWLASQGLGAAPTGPLDTMRIIQDLGFVQLDTIRNVTRAHHHILWTRNQHYREPVLGKLLGQDRAVFEHFTHDASVLPMEFYPVWQRQFRRLGERVRRSSFHQSKLATSELAAIKERISAEGPLSTRDFNAKTKDKAGGSPKEMWARPPHKKALDCMWYGGELATSHRESFIKFYDLAERVIPASLRAQEHSDEHQINWLCTAALDRLAFGTLGEIQRFWAATDATEVKNWAAQNAEGLVPVQLEGADGNWTQAFACPNIEVLLANLSPPASRLRILNPFDPAVRDRARLSRLFGFEYRNEMFVPAAKRRWGYYVYPLLEGDRFIGRIEVTANRKAGTLDVQKIWKEPGINWGKAKAEKLDAELMRFSRLAGVPTVNWTCASHPN